jgi:hypothetical protein
MIKKNDKLRINKKLNKYKQILIYMNKEKLGQIAAILNLNLV